MAPRGGGRRGGRGGRDRDGDVSMRTAAPGAGGSSSGVGKRTRTDRDGDVPMGATGSRGGKRGRGGNSSASSRGGISKKEGKAPRGKVDVSRIAKHLNGGKADQTATLKEATNEAPKTGLDEITILGIENSKAADSNDGGLRSLIAFLERKSSKKIKKSRIDDSMKIVTIMVRPEDTPSFLKLNGFSFAAAEIKVELNKPANGVSKDGQALKDKLLKMLDSRYSPAGHMLDLTSMGADPEFKDSGMFDVQRGAKFFLALMTVCDEAFTSAQQKKDSVQSVNLSQNELINVQAVASLAQTFPDLKNLSLADNKIEKVTDLDAFRRKFKSLEQLVLDGNPVVDQPNFMDELKSWFPCLQMINGVLVRTVEEVNAEARKRSQLSFNILLPRFVDPTGLGEKFLRAFFAGLDGDRASLVNLFYDANSTFSLALNPADATGGAKFEAGDPWLQKSRNLQKVNSPATRQNRCFRGADSILKAFLELPKTQHPNFDSDGHKWCIEGNILPGLPDPTGQSSQGVNGLMIIVHGEFTELRDDDTVKAIRSFDRTFTIGPGPAPDTVKICNDMLMVRVHASPDAWQQQINQAPDAAPSAMAVELQIPPGYGEASGGKTEEMVRKEYLEVELMKATRLKLSFAKECLQSTDYIPQNALAAFQAAKPNIGPEAYF